MLEKPKGESIMDDTEKPTTLSTHDTGPRQAK